VTEPRGWDLFDADEKKALSKAMNAINDAGLGFVLMAFTDEGVGAVLSNVKPKYIIGPLEQVFKAAKAGVGFTDIEKTVQ
jgi:hypothetical protein